MAKINKYWGLVAMGALTAAAAGAAVALLTKKDVFKKCPACDEDMDDFDIPFNSEDEKKSMEEDFAAWEAAQAEEQDETQTSSDEEAPCDTCEDDAQEDHSQEETEESMEEAEEEVENAMFDKEETPEE